MKSQHQMLPGDCGEENLRLFIAYGRYFVLDREVQLATISSMIRASDEPFNVLELGYGAGLLARALLERFPCLAPGAAARHNHVAQLELHVH